MGHGFGATFQKGKFVFPHIFYTKWLLCQEAPFFFPKHNYKRKNGSSLPRNLFGSTFSVSVCKIKRDILCEATLPGSPSAVFVELITSPGFPICFNFYSYAIVISRSPGELKLSQPITMKFNPKANTLALLAPL